MKFITAVIFALMISGCAATGPTFQEASQTFSKINSNIRLVIFRTKESGIASARTASLKIDGTQVGGVQYGGFTVVHAQPGNHQLTVDLPDTLGKCDINIEIDSSNEYYFEIKPRVESLGFGLIPTLIAKGDQAWSPTAKNCKGSFYIFPIEKEEALTKLKGLRLSQ
jgi:hypothetical protein